MNARYFLITLLAVCSTAQGRESADESRHKMAYLCNWGKIHLPREVEIAPCDLAVVWDMSSADLRKTMDGIWQQMAATNQQSAKSLEAAFNAAYVSAYPPIHHYTAAEMKGESTPKLCSYVRGNGVPSTMAWDELKRRNSLTVDELRLVSLHTIQIGISQIALTCSWGEPKRQNRTVTAGGESIQWIYGDRNYVYTVNGVVTAYQD